MVDIMSASQTQLIPFSELAPGEAASIRRKLIDKVVQLAVQETRLSPGQVVVRDLRPDTDLLLYTAGVDAAVMDWAAMTGTTAGAFETMGTGTNSSDRWILIYGVKLAENCSCSQLKFNIGGGDRVIWDLGGLKEDDDYVGFSPAGIVMKPNDPYTISRWVIKISSSATIVLKGVVVEPRGKVISP